MSLLSDGLDILIYTPMDRDICIQFYETGVPWHTGAVLDSFVTNYHHLSMSVNEVLQHHF